MSRAKELWNGGSHARVRERGIRQLFFNESQASLRLDFGLVQHLDEIIDSAALQQSQLKFYQQIPEWNYSQ